MECVEDALTSGIQLQTHPSAIPRYSLPGRTPKEEIHMRKVIALAFAVSLVMVATATFQPAPMCTAGHGDGELLSGGWAGHGDGELLSGGWAGHGDGELLGAA